MFKNLRLYGISYSATAGSNLSRSTQIMSPLNIYGNDQSDNKIKLIFNAFLAKFPKISAYTNILSRYI